MKTNNVLLQNIQIYAPEDLGVQDILLCGGKIVAIGRSLRPDLPDLRTLDGRGLRALPGFLDQHVHVTGGGGEAGFRSRVPELTLTDFTLNGVTTVVGVLGTDSVTRTVESLLAKTKALNEEGITAYCLTGAYDLPSPTITGSVKRDVAFLSEVLGVKAAIADHRSSQPLWQQLAKVAAQVRLGALTAGKVGVVHLHTGRGKGGLRIVQEVLEHTDLPISHFRPTHVGNCLESALAFGAQGGRIDFTAEEDPEKSVWQLFQAREQVPWEQITLSSDAGGSLPVWNDRGEMIGLGVGNMQGPYQVVRHLITNYDLPAEQALPLITSHVAQGLGLKEKGQIAVGMDGDLVLVDEDWSIHTVFARGRRMVSQGEPKVLPFLQRQ